MPERDGATQKYGTAVSVLSGWRHCPRCASALTQGEGCVECAACEFTHYAHSAPAVAAFVVDDADRVLLARRAHEPDAERWDSPGGFLQEGEHPLDGLRRELEEETGLAVEPGTFVGAFVDTYGVGPGAPPVLNLVWEARVTGGDPAPADDVTELRWFRDTELPEDSEMAFTWLAPTLRAWMANRG
jgi:ADP-ribose pyrophosphatase YjhB (NUDIX family)